MKALDRSVETLGLWIVTSSVTFIKSANQSSIKLCKIVIFLSESNRIKLKQLSQSSTQHTFCSVAVISCRAIEAADMPGLDKVLKTQELAPGPGGPWLPLNPDGPRRPWTPGSPDGPAGPWVPLYPGGPGGPGGPAGPAGPAGPTSPLVTLTLGGPLTLVLPVVFFTYSIQKKQQQQWYSQ